jgi:hypothetical protein
MIQVTYLEFTARMTFIFALLEIIICQSVAPQKIAMTRCNSLIAKREQAAVTIQKTYRGFNSRLIYEVTISDIITTESMTRIWRAISQLCSLRENHTKEVNAVTKIQAAFVSFTARKNYLYMLSRVLICQSAFRQKIAKIRCNSLLAKKESAALMIQKKYRELLGKNWFQRKQYKSFHSLLFIPPLRILLLPLQRLRLQDLHADCHHIG